MQKSIITAGVIPLLFSCIADQKTNASTVQAIDYDLPTIGILIYDGFVANEVVAPLDVFSKTDSSGRKLFNVVLIARERRPYVSSEGLKVIPDIVFAETPALKVLVMPSSANPDQQTSDSTLVQFVKDQNATTDYMASHCAGAFLIGQSGIGDNRKVVTYEGGREKLQTQFPHLRVQDDLTVAFTIDENIVSSNGNLVSYPASLAILERLTGKAHRTAVERQLMYHKIK